LTNKLEDEALEDWIIKLRREFHQHPELGFKEYETQKRILTILGELGIEARKIAGTGVIASIKGASDGPCIALRADTDALLVEEKLTERNKDYVSQKKGVMHACGHDGHMAMLFGAARLFSENRNFPGEIRLIFQPAEEMPHPSGSVKVIEDGGLEGVDAIVGMHIFTDHESGSIGIRSGPFMASNNRFTIHLKGKGGHIAKPENCIDPIRMEIEFISNLYSSLEEKLETGTYVIGIGKIAGGEQASSFPDSMEILGSYRTFDIETTQIIDKTISKCLENTMKKFKRAGNEFTGYPDYDIDILHSCPILINDPTFTDTVNSKLQESFPDKIIYSNIKQMYTAEDFASYLQIVPGTFISLGTKNLEKGIVEINHSSAFDIDEDILITGAKIFYILSTDFLKKPKKYIKSYKSQ